MSLREQKFLLVKTGGMVQRSKFFDQQLNQKLREAAPQAEFGALSMTVAEAAARIALRVLKTEGIQGSDRD
jgi:predicted GTPase